MKSFIVDKNAKLSKLALNKIQDLSFSAFMKALRKKDVKVNGKRVSEDVSLSIGDSVEIFYTPVLVQKYQVIFQDQNILVVDKKRGFSSENVFNDLEKIHNGVKFIHRLDTNTTGIMIFALNESAENELLYGFKNRTFEKYYSATVVGVPKKKEWVLCAYLFKDAKRSTVTVTDKPVKGAVPIKTGYKLIKDMGDSSLLRITLFTGKTHQIRAHLAHIGHPIVGDGKYGDFEYNAKVGVKEQMLNANQLVLHFEKQSPLYYLNDKTFISKL